MPGALSLPYFGGQTKVYNKMKQCRARRPSLYSGPACFVFCAINCGYLDLAQQRSYNQNNLGLYSAAALQWLRPAWDAIACQCPKIPVRTSKGRGSAMEAGARANSACPASEADCSVQLGESETCSASSSSSMRLGASSEDRLDTTSEFVFSNPSIEGRDRSQPYCVANICCQLCHTFFLRGPGSRSYLNAIPQLPRPSTPVATQPTYIGSSKAAARRASCLLPADVAARPTAAVHQTLPLLQHAALPGHLPAGWPSWAWHRC